MLSGGRSVLWTRQLDGALNRVPTDFYDKVWHILDRTAAGIKVAGYHLPQVQLTTRLLTCNVCLHVRDC